MNTISERRGLFIKRPYFARLLIYGISISLIPLFMLGYSLAGKATDSIQGKVNESNAHLLYQKKQRVEQALRNADRLAAQLITSELMQNALESRLEPADFRRIEDLKQALGRMASLEAVISDVFLINADRLWSISNSGWQRYGSKEAMEPLLRYTDTVLSGGWALPKADERLFGSETVLLIKHLPVNSPEPRGFLILCLSTERLSKLLEEPEGAAHTMMLDHEGRAFAGDRTYAEQVSSVTGWQTEEVAYTSERGKFRAGSRQMSVQRQLSDMNGWTYASVASVQDVTREAKGLLWFTALLLIAGGITAIGLSYAGSHRLYRPIRRMTSLYAGEGRPFSPARKTDEVSFLYERMRIQASELKSFFIAGLLQGQSRAASIRDGLADYGYRPEEWTMLQTVAIGIDSLNGTRFQEKDRDLLLFAINNVASDLIGEDECLVPVVSGQVQATVWLGRDQDEERFQVEIGARLKAVHQAIEDVLAISVSLGVSRIFRKPEEIVHSFREAIDALKHRPSLGGGAILYIHDVELVESRRSDYPSEEAEALINAVKTLEHPDRIGKLLDAVLDRIYLEQRNIKERRFYLGRLIYEWIGFLHKMDDSLLPKPDDAEALVESLHELVSLEDIRERLLQSLILPALCALTQRRDGQYDMIAQFVEDAVKREYNMNITLEACAVRLHYHPDYIGRVDASDTKIVEIARGVGYANSQNFIRQFRKAEGMTPGEYRARQSGKQ